MPPHLITATGLKNEVQDADSGEAATGIETSAKDTSVVWMPYSTKFAAFPTELLRTMTTLNAH